MGEPGRYGAHARFVDPARASDSPRLLLIGILLVELAYLASVYLMDPLLLLIPLASPAEVTRGHTPRGLLIQLASFVVLGLAVLLVSRRLHGRGFVSLIGPPGRMARQLLRVTLVLGGVVLLVEFVPPDPDLWTYAERRPWPEWLALLPLALAALLIQTGAEELFYRGYVQQQLAARFAQPWVWLVLPSLLFATAHWSSDLPPAEALHYVIWAFFFGLAAADLTARSGTLGPAIGFHLVNNALAFLFYGEAGAADSGLALFLFPAPLPDLPGSLPDLPPDHPPLPVALVDPALLVELAGIGLLWVGARLAIRR
jgi:uncharacterized protein